MKRRQYWCPGCGCDNSKFVKAHAQALIAERAKRANNARQRALSPEQRRAIASKAGKAGVAKRRAQRETERSE